MTSPIEILSRSMRELVQPRRTRISGVYLLIKGCEVIYIGSSGDLELRVETHAIGNTPTCPRKDFDRVLWLRLPAKVMRHYEGALIRFFSPRYNGQAPKAYGHDAEILHGLGLSLPDNVVSIKTARRRIGQRKGKAS